MFCPSKTASSKETALRCIRLTAGYSLHSVPFSDYCDSARHGEVDFVVQNGMHIALVEVKSGGDYRKHRAIDNVLSVGEWSFANAYVLCKDNLALEGDVTYLPWYMVMFLRPAQIPKGLTYVVDLSGLDV